MLSTEIQITLHHKIQTKTLHKGTTELNIQHTTSIISPVLTNQSIGLVKRSFFPPSEVFVSNTYKTTVPHLVQRPPHPSPTKFQHTDIFIQHHCQKYEHKKHKDVYCQQTSAGFSFHFFLVSMYKNSFIYSLKKPHVTLCSSLGLGQGQETLKTTTPSYIYTHTHGHGKT